MAEFPVQGIFIRFWTSSLSSGNRNAAKRYLFRSAYNASIDHIRHSKVEEKRLRRYLYIHDDFSTMEDLLAETEIRFLIEKARERLPEKCRQIFRQELAIYLCN